jgi:dipeptidyl aminopeptidase/acylaminoacyl peptidase
MPVARLLVATILSSTLCTTALAESSDLTNAPTPAPRPIALEDINRVKVASPPRVSPDGRTIVFVVDGQIQVVPARGGEVRQITSPGSTASEPQWSRDGRSLYFLSDRTGRSQLFRLPMDTYGEASQVTTFERGVETLTLSPDESRLLLTFTDEALKSPVPPNDAAAPKQEPPPKPWVIDRLHFKEDAADGYLTGDRADHLHVLDLTTKQLRQVTSGTHADGEGAWSPDGRSIVFTSNRETEPDASYKSDLWLVATDGADAGSGAQRLTNDDWTKSSPAWSPDGRSIAYIGAIDGVYGIQQLVVIPAESGGTPRVLTSALDRWVDSFRWSPDGGWIYFVYEQLGGAHLARVRPRDGKLERLLEGERQISAFDAARDGTVAALIQNMNDAPEVYAVVKGRATRLTSINDAFLREVARGSKEKIEFRSADGTPIEAFVTKPPGFDASRLYPTVLHIHGGPVGQFAYGYDFTPQYLAASGYVVVEPNPRGSTGRGQDFTRAIYQTWGITDYDDVIGAINRVIELGIADHGRLAVMGYSYGGYMTNTVVTRTNRFKAAASGAGHSLIVANYGHDIYQKWYNWELGVPWENQEKYARLSPLTQAGKVTTPTIFLGGRDDWNVPVLNAELFYQSLRQRGIETQLVVYPKTHHGGWSEDFDKDFLLRIRQWFDKHLKAD